MTAQELLGKRHYGTTLVVLEMIGEEPIDLSKNEEHLVNEYLRNLDKEPLGDLALMTVTSFIRSCKK